MLNIQLLFLQMLSFQPNIPIANESFFTKYELHTVCLTLFRNAKTQKFSDRKTRTN